VATYVLWTGKRLVRLAGVHTYLYKSSTNYLAVCMLKVDFFWWQIRSCVDQYAHIFIFSVQNMRNNKLKDIRQEWRHSRWDTEAC